MTDTTAIWATALSGGLAGAVLNQSWQCLRSWWRKPELSVEFDENIEGCVVEDVPQKNLAGEICGKKKFLRLRVFNNGRTTALDVQVIIAKISRDGSPQWTFAGEVLDALWSHSNDLRLDIPSKTPRFADVSASDYAVNPVELMLCVRGGAPRLETVELTGVLALEVYVAARNAATVPKTIKVQFHGTAASLQIVRDEGK
ncbi:MAG: hypothetical protein ACLP4V_30260 [Methylocella sp.]